MRITIEPSPPDSRSTARRTIILDSGINWDLTEDAVAMALDGLIAYTHSSDNVKQAAVDYGTEQK